MAADQQLETITATGEDSFAPEPFGAIHNYRVIRQLGEGGMGVVFEAEQQHPRRHVALKMIRSGRAAGHRARRQFEREAEALGHLRHPNIATIYESGCAPDGQPYLTMELVDGIPLQQWLKEQAPSTTLRKTDAAPRLHLFRAICEAMVYAHQNGVIHRDLKPSNIMVPIKILDFGLARVTNADTASPTITESGLVQGSLPFMSPEQARGETGRIDTRTDIYSLGVILYWLLTQRHPYMERPAASFAEAINAICKTPPTPFRQVYERFDSELETIAGKAMEKEPERRYPSVSALLADIDNYLADLPIVARPPSASYQIRKLVQRHRTGFAGIAGLLTLLLTFSVVTLVQSRQLHAERDRASHEAATAKQVSQLLADLFRNANPRHQGKGELTARQLLDTGRKRLDEDRGIPPEVRARVVENIAKAYAALGQPVSPLRSVH